MAYTPSVIYISLDGMTDPLGQSQVLPYLIKLSEEYTIYLISAEKPERYKQLNEKIDSLCKKSNINWRPVVYEKGESIFQKIKNPARLFLKTYQLAKTVKPCIVHCRSYIPALIGYFIAKQTNARLLFDMRGFWADERVDGNIWSLNSFKGRLLYKTFKISEKFLIKNSNAIITLTHSAKSIIQDWRFYNPQIPITVIPCCADTKHFSIKNVNTIDAENYREKLELTAFKKIVTYLGSVGTWYMTDEMMNFFRIQLSFEPLSVFLILTPDSKETVFEYAKKANVPLNNVRVYFAQRYEVPAILSLSSYSIFFIKPTFSKAASSPTKLAELMAMGIPIITNKGIGDVTSIVNKTKAGVCVDNFDEKSYTNALKKLNSMILNREQLQMACFNEFSLEVGVERYKEVYKYLCR